MSFEPVKHCEECGRQVNYLHDEIQEAKIIIEDYYRNFSLWRCKTDFVPKVKAWIKRN